MNGLDLGIRGGTRCSLRSPGRLGRCHLSAKGCQGDVLVSFMGTWSPRWPNAQDTVLELQGTRQLWGASRGTEGGDSEAPPCCALPRGLLTEPRFVCL